MTFVNGDLYFLEATDGTTLRFDYAEMQKIASRYYPLLSWETVLASDPDLVLLRRSIDHDVIAACRSISKQVNPNFSFQSPGYIQKFEASPELSSAQQSLTAVLDEDTARAKAQEEDAAAKAAADAELYTTVVDEAPSAGLIRAGKAKKKETTLARVRRGVDSITQGLATWTDTTKETDATARAPKAIDLGDPARQAAARDVASSYQHTRVIEPGDDLTASANSVLLSRSLGLSTGDIPLVAFGAGPGREHLDNTNRPYIQIVSTSGNANTLVDVGHVYDRFILTSLTEQSVEKLDAVETFGAPHVFASGRFILKLALTGFVRSVPRSPSATEQKIGRYELEDFTLPDHQVFRYFYDNYLRGTQLANRGAIARLYVDGDIYEGVFQNLVYNRDSQMEQAIPWGMNMLVLKHTNVNDAASARNLRRFDDLKPVVRQFADNVAAAHLENAIGKCYITLGGDNAPAFAAGRGFSPFVSDGQLSVGEIKGDTVQAATSESLFLYMAGSPQILSVESTTVQGLVLTADGKDDLNGQLTTGTSDNVTKFRLGVKVTNYAALYASRPADAAAVGDSGGPENTVGASDRDPTISFTITTLDGTSVTVRVNVTVNDAPELTLTETKITIGSGPEITVPADTTKADLATLDALFGQGPLTGGPIKVTQAWRASSGTAVVTASDGTVDVFASTVLGSRLTEPKADLLGLTGSPALVSATVPTGVAFIGTLAFSSGKTLSLEDSCFQVADGLTFVITPGEPKASGFSIKTPVKPLTLFSRHPAQRNVGTPILGLAFKFGNARARTVGPQQGLLNARYDVEFRLWVADNNVGVPRFSNAVMAELAQQFLASAQISLDVDGSVQISKRAALGAVTTAITQVVGVLGSINAVTSTLRMATRDGQKVTLNLAVASDTAKATVWFTNLRVVQSKLNAAEPFNGQAGHVAVIAGFLDLSSDDNIGVTNARITAATATGLLTGAKLASETF